MKKVLLISANRMKKPYPVYPLGLDYVVGVLNARYETKILDVNELSSLEKLGEQVRSYTPDYIGLSIRNIDNTDTINSKGFLSDYQQLVDVIRRNSQAPLILGAAAIRFSPRIYPCAGCGLRYCRRRRTVSRTAGSPGR